MHTENYLELFTKNGNATIAKSSIAIMQDSGADGTMITMKEKNKDGSQIVFIAQQSYAHLKSEINKFEKIQ